MRSLRSTPRVHPGRDVHRALKAASGANPGWRRSFRHGAA